jgi:hypothetical protein
LPESFLIPVVIARFMRAIQFSFCGEKMGCPDKPGNDEFF